MAYLAMALNIGDIWVRYVDWVLSTPLLLIDLGCECLVCMYAPKPPSPCDRQQRARCWSSQLAVAPALALAWPRLRSPRRHASRSSPFPVRR